MSFVATTVYVVAEFTYLNCNHFSALDLKKEKNYLYILLIYDGIKAIQIRLAQMCMCIYSSYFI